MSKHFFRGCLGEVFPQLGEGEVGADDVAVRVEDEDAVARGVEVFSAPCGVFEVPFGALAAGDLLVQGFVVLLQGPRSCPR
jgi:hypothetical protein